MSFRDDHEATRARLEALERELAQTRARADEADAERQRLRAALAAAGHALPEADGVAAISLPAAPRPAERPIVVVIQEPARAPRAAPVSLTDAERAGGTRPDDPEVPLTPEQARRERGLVVALVFWMVAILVIANIVAGRCG